MEKKLEKKYKVFIRSSWLILIGGILLFGIGIFRFFFIEPDIAVNLKTQQPFMKNGTIALVLGIGLFAIGLYRILNREKTFKSEIDTAKEIEEKENQERRKNMGY